MVFVRNNVLFEEKRDRSHFLVQVGTSYISEELLENIEKVVKENIRQFCLELWQMVIRSKSICLPLIKASDLHMHSMLYPSGSVVFISFIL